MTFAVDKVKDYIKQNLSNYHDRIQVNQMLDYLPCLTEMDKQQIRASVDRNGNNESVWLFFDLLQKRSGWVPQLLRALHATHLGDIAEDIQRVYAANQIRPPSRPPAPPAPLGGDVSRAAVPARGDSNPPSDVHQCPPRNELMPGRVSPPLSDDPPRPAVLTPVQSLHHLGDCSTPVQETKHPMSSNDVAVKPKKPQSATPDQEKREESPGGDGVTVADITSRRSPNQSLRGMPREGLLPTTPPSSRSGAGPQQTVSPDPRTSSDNQPEEDYYSSTDSALSTPRGPDEPRDTQSRDLHFLSTVPCKSPVQVSEPSRQETTPKQRKEEVMQPNRNNALGSSRTHRICDTNEVDYVPPKPGALTSHTGEIPKLGDGTLNGHTTNPAYSGDTDRLCLSDSLMISRSSQNSLSEERCSAPADGNRRRTTARTGPAQPENGNHLDDGSITVLSGRIEQPPSFDLRGAPGEDPDVPTSRFRGSFPDPDQDHHPINGASSYPKNSDHAHPNQKAKDEKPSPWGNPVWPAVGLALAFGVLALLRWLKK